MAALVAQLVDSSSGVGRTRVQYPVPPGLRTVVPTCVTRSGDRLPFSRSLEEEEKEPSCKWTNMCLLEGREVEFVVDTGSPVSLLPRHLVHGNLRAPELSLRAYDLFIYLFISPSNGHMDIQL